MGKFLNVLLKMNSFTFGKPSLPAGRQANGLRLIANSQWEMLNKYNASIKKALRPNRTKRLFIFIQ
jgi:hypothetical protein